jgi:hypothetical protein
MILFYIFYSMFGFQRSATSRAGDMARAARSVNRGPDDAEHEGLQRRGRPLT